MITLTVITKNEEKNIKNCIQSFKNIKNISEILIVDDYSTDKTRDIAQKLGAKILKRHLDNDYSKQHGFANQKAKNNWILSIDADEQATPSLISFLDKFNPHRDIKAYSFYRSDIFLGQKLKHGENGSNRFTRLFHKKYGKFIHPVHETWKSTEPIQPTNALILHHSHQNLSNFLYSINRYTTIRSNYLYKQNTNVSFLEIIFYPKIKFLYNYLILLGILDKMPGLIMALGMSFHSFLVRAKLWHLHQKK